MKAIFAVPNTNSTLAPDTIDIVTDDEEDMVDQTTLTQLVDDALYGCSNDEVRIYGPYVAPMVAIRDTLLSAAQRITHALPKQAKVSHPSDAMVDAMRLIHTGLTPYAAAQKAGIALSTMYRSKLYKQWKKEAGK